MSPSAATFNASRLRRTVLDMAYAGATVHIACAFSIIELLAVLYRSYVRYPDDNPEHPARDFLILSKGHGVMAQYACLLEKQWLSRHDIDHYFADGSLLKGLSDSRVPGLEVSSGSLGHGLSVGVGLALAAKLDQTGQRTFALLGDGELNEGTIWEAAMFAAHHQLNDLTVLIDANGFQAMGKTDDIIGLGSIESKFASFGFETMSVDGHDEQQIHAALDTLGKSPSTAPKALVARTIKGRGVSFMEHDNRWHYARLDADSYARAIHQLSEGSA
ncbi:transketolase [Herbaspirillum sp. AP02]|uniref:transketolase n=1 Tax=unclassified Herbaspirillum TaxID=2624150 RepID=UPI0015DBA90E|nr:MULTISPECIES: transketolase [unclassified Herbaspirillum]MBG7620172.1 transketolase [Herbaspirillum sp. AP02]NZD67636.1 transketolase [Herbaspirillum sp. AP21]